MVRQFRVVTDSTADVLPAWRERYGIEVVPLTVLFGSEAFRDRVDLNEEEFFERLGRAIRHHPAFAPRGINANFVAPAGPSRLRMRTYERGGEAETLACGTGAVAVALIAHRRGLATSPVAIETSGGGTLEIGFRVARTLRN